MLNIEKNIFAVLSCDIVDSTSLSSDGMFELAEKIQECFYNITFHKGYDFWGRVVKGDYIECIFENPRNTLRVALALKCFLKYWLESVDASPVSSKYAFRSSIGIGKMRIVNRQRDIMDGDAIYIAGRNLSRMSKRQFARVESYNVPEDVSDVLSSMYMLVDSLVNELSAKQAIVIYYKLLDASEKEISSEIHLSQPAVNLRAKSGKWDLIEDTVLCWENFRF